MLQQKRLAKTSVMKMMIKGIVIAIAAASFFAGYGIGTFDTTDTDDAELNEIIAELNAKIDSTSQSKKNFLVLAATPSLSLICPMLTPP